MTVSILLDENVSLDVCHRLQSMGYEVLAIAQLAPQRGIEDPDVFKLAQEKQRLLITRDWHFTNSLRFPPKQVKGILYLMDGNLKGSDEADLVEKFLKAHSVEMFSGRLVFLSLDNIRIR